MNLELGTDTVMADLATLCQYTGGLIQALEDEAVHILREAAACFENPVILFSGGKDSAVVLHLAQRAFAPGPVPFALMHVDTGHNFPEVLTFRDRAAADADARLIVASVQESIDKGRVVEREAGASRIAAQAVTLLDAIEQHRIDACIGGARRDEEKARAKERVFSHRDAFGQWDPRNQRPEPWGNYNTRIQPGENMRVFPLSNWTESDVWRYIVEQDVPLPSLYFAHQRDVVSRDGRLFPVSPLIEARDGEEAGRLTVRFRTVGDMSCTCPTVSDAATRQDVLAETLAARLSERGETRADDATSEASMEIRKKAGYF